MNRLVRFQVLTVAIMKMTVFLDMVSCSFVAPKMEEVYISETSVYFYETTRSCIPESCHIHTRRPKNLNSLTFAIKSFDYTLQPVECTQF
jgi:hypothetical protein